MIECLHIRCNDSIKFEDNSYSCFDCIMFSIIIVNLVINRGLNM